MHFDVNVSQFLDINLEHSVSSFILFDIPIVKSIPLLKWGLFPICFKKITNKNNYFHRYAGNPSIDCNFCSQFYPLFAKEKFLIVI